MIRVFPRKTNASPNDPDARFGPPGLFDHGGGIVHVSCTFSYDRSKAEDLAIQWKRQGYDVEVGGPAYETPGDEFVPGVYMKRGYVITSRGCPNKCWFCSVWKKEKGLKLLPIREGYIINDDNLLACPESHIRAVFDMLRKQTFPAEFAGGLEAKLFKEWHVELLNSIRFNQLWFAYDTPDDYEPLVEAGRVLIDADISLNHRRCYVLIGYPGDTLDNADKRLRRAWTAGFIPMAMLYRDSHNTTTYEWRRFQKWWARPASIKRMCISGKTALP